MAEAPPFPARRVLGALVLLGLSSAIIQTLFARELMVSFAGDESVIAAVLGPWLLATAAGAAFGRSPSLVGAERAARAHWVLLSAAPLAVLGLLSARLVPLGFRAGATPGAAVAFAVASVLLAPSCLAFGAAFSLLLGLGSASEDARLSRALTLESLGAALGGAALCLVLLGRAPVLSLGLGAAAAAAGAAALVGPRTRLPALGVGALALALAFTPVDRWAWNRALPGIGVARIHESKMASLLVARDHGATTVLVNRAPVAASDDRVAAEELVHVPLALAREPRAVAIVGVPPAGTFDALRSHGVLRIDWLLEDDALGALLEQVIAGFSGVGVTRIPGDVRASLRARRGSYDAILSSLPEPRSARQNRDFTREQLATMVEALTPGGLVAIALPGHAEWASPATRRLHSSLRQTLVSAAGTVRIAPLGATLYLARPSAALDPLDADAIARVLARRGVEPIHLGPATLTRLMSAPRLAEAERWASLAEPANRDLFPTTARLALARAAEATGDVGLELLGLVAVGLGLGIALALAPRRRAVELGVLTTGATGLTTQLVLLSAYQIAVGALYGELGLLLAGFLAGNAFGAAIARRAGEPRRLLLACELAAFALPLALAAALPAFVATHGWPARALGFALAGLAGVIPGAELAAAGRLRPAAGGALYAADLAGAALAALCTLTFAVPALGLVTTLVASSALKSPSLVLTSVSSPEQDHPTASIPLLPAAFVVSIAAMVLDETEAGLYAATFARGYQLACVALLIVTTLAAFEPTWLAAGLGRAARRLSAWRARLGERPWRLVSFALLVPLAASPLGRCYFRVPFLLCHVCPRQCAFGVMRPYLVPAALIANLRGRRFCEAVCPLGMVGRSLERTRARRAARVAKLWIPRALVLVLTAVAYLWAWSDRGEGVRGGPFYQALYRNVYAPSLGVLLVAALVLLLSIFVRRPFCDGLCPIGASSDLLDALARRQTVAGDAAPVSLVRRRKFLEQSAAGAGAVLVGGEALSELAFGGSEPTLAVGFRNDAPGPLDDVARPAAFASRQGGLVRCTLCPHECILGENDRGFCRTRVVKGGRLYTLAYGNLCSRHLDPMEKKPLYHFLPATPIVSVAMGGCNLRCLNCQNWEISQSRPHEVASMTLLPAELARTTRERGARAVAYTYSEPLVAYEYVRDSAALAREQGLANVLVTAGYVSERPLRELCRVIDAVTLDVKAFREEFYREVSGARLSPVLRTLEVLREERVWTEVSFLMVPTLSDDTREIGAFAGWVAKHLGRGTPLHILRFHPAHRLKHLPPTPVAAMEEARLRARDAGLDFVYLGNVPGHDANHTRCPKDGRVLIERNGFQVRENHLIAGRCPCGEVIPGVFA